MFETMMADCVSGLKESVLSKGPRESELFDNDANAQEVASLLQASFSAFTQVFP